MAGPTDDASATTPDGAPSTPDGLGALERGDTSPESGATVTSDDSVRTDSAPAASAVTGAPATSDEPTFFDPSDLSPELAPAYKQMQRAFTQKTQEIARHRDKIKAYDAALNDPRGTIEMLARQYGIPVKFGNETSNGAPAADTSSWEPNDWNEVLERARKEAKADVMREIQPFIGDVRRSQLEMTLDSDYPGWREHEERFVDTMRAHPTLINDVQALYNAAMPPDVLQALATQKALKSLEKRGDANKSKPSSSLRKPETVPKVKTLNDAYLLAKRQLAERGG